MAIGKRSYGRKRARWDGSLPLRRQLEKRKIFSTAHATPSLCRSIRWLPNVPAQQHSTASLYIRPSFRNVVADGSNQAEWRLIPYKAHKCADHIHARNLTHFCYRFLLFEISGCNAIEGPSSLCFSRCPYGRDRHRFLVHCKNKGRQYLRDGSEFWRR